MALTGRDLHEEIVRFLEDSPENRHPGIEGPIFERPLLGVASAEDPLFARYKEVIGTFHRTPSEILPGATSVAVWVLPIPRPARLSNCAERARPSIGWARTRSFGEDFNVSLRRHAVCWLEARGHAAVAPMLAPDWARIDSTPVGIASTWSERHAAYAAGLGSFSLSDGFITPAGIAHRLGSIVTTARLEPTSQGRPDVWQHCLGFDGGHCDACVRRCPAGAISGTGHDKDRCNAYLETMKPALAAEWGTPIPGCGLCQVGVPCESRVPPRHKRGGEGSR